MEKTAVRKYGWDGIGDNSESYDFCATLIYSELGAMRVCTVILKLSANILLKFCRKILHYPLRGVYNIPQFSS